MERSKSYLNFYKYDNYDCFGYTDYNERGEMFGRLFCNGEEVLSPFNGQNDIGCNLQDEIYRIWCCCHDVGSASQGSIAYWKSCSLNDVVNMVKNIKLAYCVENL